MKAKIDKFLGKFISKKLTVFIIACVFIYTSKILPSQWVNIAMVYIGSQAAVDMLIALRRK
tara:strand:+ start:240 stop:422 length:183 start_codon:yes stop_codon:yes gene_type:complete